MWIQESEHRILMLVRQELDRLSRPPGPRTQFFKDGSGSRCSRTCTNPARTCPLLMATPKQIVNFFQLHLVFLNVTCKLTESPSSSCSFYRNEQNPGNQVQYLPFHRRHPNTEWSDLFKATPINTNQSILPTKLKYTDEANIPYVFC